MEKEELFHEIDEAIAGNEKALETVILSVQELVFNLSLRMLGTLSDAEDATQEILLKVVTHLSSFRKESAFSTWVFRIAVNHLKDYKKHMFASQTLSFEYYAHDIEHPQVREIPDMSQNVEKDLLADELKMSCTNVMLQCLDSESRCIFILGTMFQIDSRIAGEILQISPEAYRQKLSRTRKKVAEFLKTYCGEYGSGNCHCINRIDYAILTHRLQPQNLEYTSSLDSNQSLIDVKNAMEEIESFSEQFKFLKIHQSSHKTKQFIMQLLKSTQMTAIQNTQMEEVS